MGSWAGLSVRGKEVFRWKSEVDPTFLFLFTREDVRYTPLQDPDDDPYANPTLVLTASVGVLADRLDALGIAAADLEGCFEHAIEDQIAQLEATRDAPWGLEDVDPAIDDLRTMTFANWVERVREAIPAYNPLHYPRRTEYHQLKSLMELWADFDPRWLLRALLEACDSSEDVLLDLTDLELSGYLEAHDFDPQTAATVMFSVALLNGAPAVVITEGTTDAEFLKAAIEVRRPHISRFIRFYDFGSVPGGASVALSTIKSLAAAGVNNRVVVLLDNDTAARDARRSLRKVELPRHYVVDHYPDIPLAARYPSVGPTGSHTGDVNGLAGSIEVYLGADVLKDPTTGELRPVRWGSHITSLHAYQGEIVGKSAIHDAFRAKVAAAREDPSVVAAQDWSGMDAILDRLMELLRTCGVADPAQREGFGPRN